MSRQLALVVLLLIACAGVIIYLIQFPRAGEAFGYPLDDGWIHATYARNLAERGEFAFNPGEKSTGTTSFLWTLFLSLTFRITGNMVLSAHMLGAASFFFFIAALYKFSKEVFHSEWLAFLSSLFAIVSGITMWWSLSGMETILFLALGISSLQSYVRHKWISAACQLSLLALTRPEGILLTIIILSHFFLRIKKEKSSHQKLFAFGAISSIGVFIYIGWNLMVTGKFVTTTLAGRRWLAHAPMHIPFDPLVHLNSAFIVIFRWMRILAFSFIPQGDVPGNFFAGLFLALIVVGMIFGIQKIRSGQHRFIFFILVIGFALASISFFPESSVDHFVDRMKNPSGTSILHSAVVAFESTGTGLSSKRVQIVGVVIGSMLLTLSAFLFFARLSRNDFSFKKQRTNLSAFGIFVLWFLIHNMAYIIFIPYPGHGGRYQSMNVVLIILLAVRGLHVIGNRFPIGSRARKAQLVFQFISIIAFGYIGMYAFSNWKVTYFSTVQHINTIHKQTAQWTARYTAANARIAAFDIGAMGYFSSRYIIDLGGLITSDPIPYMEIGEIDKYIQQKSATHIAMIYLFDEEQVQNSLADRLGIMRSNLYQTVPIYHAQFDSLAWRRNVSLSGNAYPVMQVYSIGKAERK